MSETTNENRFKKNAAKWRPAAGLSVASVKEVRMVDRKKVEETLRKLAAQEGRSVEAIRADIQEAIDAAYDNPEPKYRKEWEKVPFEGERPTAEDVILYISRQMEKRKK